MSPEAKEMFTFVKLTSGRRMHAFIRVREIAVPYNDTEVITHVDEALTHEQYTFDLNQRWKTKSDTKSLPLSDVAGLLDQTLSSTRALLTAYVRGALPEDDKRTAAERVLAAVFPGGVFAVTSLPYVEKLTTVEHILSKLGGELRMDAEALSMDHMIARLSKLVAWYSQELAAASNKLTFAQVSAARERGHEYQLELVSMVLGRYYKTNDPTHATRRESLLAPIVEQDQAMRAIARTRRRSGNTPNEDIDTDVGPVSGDGDTPATGTTDPAPGSAENNNAWHGGYGAHAMNNVDDTEELEALDAEQFGLMHLYAHDQHGGRSGATGRSGADDQSAAKSDARSPNAASMSSPRGRRG